MGRGPAESVGKRVGYGAPAYTVLGYCAGEFRILFGLGDAPNKNNGQKLKGINSGSYTYVIRHLSTLQNIWNTRFRGASWHTIPPEIFLPYQIYGTLDLGVRLGARSPNSLCELQLG